MTKSPVQGDQTLPTAPTLEQIQRRFRSLPVIGLRPVVLTGVLTLRVARRFDWKAVGLEHLEGLEPPVVFAANHHSHVDTAAILGTLPRRLRGRTAVAAALDVFGCPSRGRSLSNGLLQLTVAAGFHAFAFDRHGPALRSIRTSARLVERGWSLLLYPEGTRSRTGQMGPFKAGVGLLARFGRRPVVPIFVDGGRQVLPHRAFLPRPGRILVRYGPPMWAEPRESPEAFTRRLREQVVLLGRGEEAVTTVGAEPQIETTPAAAAAAGYAADSGIHKQPA
jgi:1-acyl-sn-glycerol-3-phosphate acyltransferase